MENSDSTEKDVKTDSVKSTSGVDSEQKTENSEKQNVPEKKKSDPKNRHEPDFAFHDIDPLDFRKTPQRNRELHHFRDILKSPCINVPVLIMQRQEDILPLLSLYLQEESKQNRFANFFSVTPSDFGLDRDNESPYELEKRMNFAGTMIEDGDEDGSIPVYCDLGDYMDQDVFGDFIVNFLQPGMPAVLCVNQTELEAVREVAVQNRQISGGIENPDAPYEPHGLARTRELEISPLTREEKQVYFSHYIEKWMQDKKLTCSPEVCRYFINQMVNRFPHQDVFFKVFDAMNQVIVMTEKTQQPVISKKIINKVLKEYAPLHNHTKALADLDERLKQKIYGQDQAIETCYETILADLDDDSRTRPTVLGFFGPSGVGKTALAEEISLALTGKRASIINMAEYSDSFKVSILTGSSKGYVDSDEDGLLAKIIKENPRSVILLDEFEKAHPIVQQMFLGVFDKGSLYDNHSGQVDMSQTTIILTSNAGIRPSSGLGFGSPAVQQYVADKGLIQEAFPPELLGRLDAKVLFNPLSQATLGKIVDKFMLQFKPRFDKLGIQVALAPEAKQELVETAQDPTAGARPILSLMRQKVKTPIEIGVLKKKIKKGSRVIVKSVAQKKMDILPKGQIPSNISMLNQNTQV